ncbi:Ser/Thr protein phosphatase [Tritrichomonas foetus]|uniref:Serine/threonine-protein phosphatase n=1 Tax=Tritrichomonas foetus TaxID=1144522 RepID=A0A1J4KTW5_9EUKA|nr:Ser/Thr protein phosphatase [Tritrichomonas foetus]|eukprot:OHT14703.1 Ser/Thr protein phosphatase [Tritrichomonas foetus]
MIAESASVNSCIIVLEKYNEILSLKDLDFSQVGHSIPLPRFSKLIVSNLIGAATQKFEKDPTVLHLTGNFVVVGDLHGSLPDLLRVLFYNQDDDMKFLFLGDYVDRGPFSVEVITLLFALAVVFPEKYYLIRGNHEFSEVNSKYGFYQQIVSEYKDERLFNKCNICFSHLPIAAVLNEVNFCVHGGISDQFKYISQIEEIKKPITDFSQRIICDLMWSDPSDNANDTFFLENTRGKGKLFGLCAVLQFCERNKPIERIIRGHQCAKDGVSTIFKNIVVTVFTASNYCGIYDNQSGIIKVRENAHVEKTVYPLIPFLSKNSCNQIIIESTTNGHLLPPLSPTQGPTAPKCFIRPTGSFRRTIPWGPLGSPPAKQTVSRIPSRRASLYSLHMSFRTISSNHSNPNIRQNDLEEIQE